MSWCLSQLQWPRSLWVINVGQPNEAQNKPGSKFLSSGHYIAFDVLQKKGSEPTADRDSVFLRCQKCENIQFCVIIQNLLKLHNEISSTKRLCSVRDQVFHWLNTELLWIFVCECKEKDFFLPRKKKRMPSPSEQYWVCKPDSSAKEREYWVWAQTWAS